jgi:hypothetical protein
MEKSLPKDEKTDLIQSIDVDEDNITITTNDNKSLSINVIALKTKLNELINLSLSN